MEERTVTCIGINGEKAEVPVSQLQFRPSVYGVIVRDGKVLLSSQWDGWDFPGGGIEIGESITEAFAREIKEETGLTATPGELLRVGDQFFTHPNTKAHCHTIVIYYTAKDVSGEISTAHLTDEEKLYTRAAEWIPVSEIGNLKFYNQEDSVGLIHKAMEQ
ncbi:MAG: phosphohydrolase [Candidatus Kaiserbacteria bacterium]|nr:phosphohydrolase [Candidatus Kaiserbacteria bacterium]